MRKTSWLALGALSCLMAIEIVLHILPTPTATRFGQYFDPFVTTYPAGLEFRSSTGWSMLNAQWQRSNQYGFIPDQPFERSPEAVALIGDSLVEQSMLAPSRRLAAILQEERGDAPVYAMGIPGSSLFDYLERIRYAREKLGIETFWIVIERADVRESLCSGGVYTDACMDAKGEIMRVRKPPRGVLHDALAHSSLLQYFLGVLRLSPERILAVFRDSPAVAKAVAADPASRAAALPPAQSRVIDRFLDALDAMKPVKVGLVIDPEVSALRRQEEFADSSLAQMYRRAQQRGIAVVHPWQALARESAETGLEMRVGPYDAHWNPLGNCVIAGEVLATLPAAAIHPDHGSGAGRSAAACVALMAGLRRSP